MASCFGQKVRINQRQGELLAHMVTIHLRRPHYVCTRFAASVHFSAFKTDGEQIMQQWKCWIALTVLGTSALCVYAEEKPTVQAYSVSVRKRLTREDAKIAYEERPGTRIQAVLSLPGKTMLAVDEKASKLESFKDDLGTDLTKADDTFPGGNRWVESFAFKASEKGDRALTVFNAAGVPASGAKKILMRGTLSILCGGTTKTAELKEVELKVDPKAKIKLGEVTFTVEKSLYVGDVSVKFESSSPNIRSASFTTTTGQAITTDKPNTSRFGFDNKYTYNTSYNLRTKADKINITLTYFEKTEVVNLPVELSVGIGLE